MTFIYANNENTGVCGLGLGSVAGLFRSTTPILFAAASSIQCFTLGTSFWGNYAATRNVPHQAHTYAIATRQAGLIYQARKYDCSIQDVQPRQRLLASSVAGGVSGATAAALFRESHKLCQAILL